MSTRSTIVKITLLGAMAAALLGCEAANQKIMSADEGEAGSYPAQYREIAREYFQKSLFDPYSVRDAQISKPKPGKLFVEGTLGIHEPGWLVCLRANAKNRMGAYAGLSDTAFVIRGDRVLASLGDPEHSNYVVKMICDSEKYENFREMERPRTPPPGR